MSNRPAVEHKKRKKHSAITLADGDSPPASFRYNIVITWSAAANAYVVSPGTMLMPNGFGTGVGNWPSPAYLKWYIIPNGTDTVTFNNTNGQSGISFTGSNPPTVAYDPANVTASVQWTNSASTEESFVYDVNLLVNGTAVTVDPDVENQAPPN